MAFAPALFKPRAMKLVAKLQFLFWKVQYFENVTPIYMELVSFLSLLQEESPKCGNLGGTSLVLVASKLPVTVNLPRLYNTCEQHTREEQTGFRVGCGFVNPKVVGASFYLQKAMIIVFVDIHIVFDFDDRSVL